MMPTKKSSRHAPLAPRDASTTVKAIDEHPLLTPELCKLAKHMLRISTTKHETFSLLNFAEINLRATGRDYADVSNINIAALVKADLAHKRAAILYAYEALRASEVALVFEWDGMAEALDTLQILSTALP
jgi:hypothetical protein